MLNEKLSALAPDGQPFQLTTLQNQAGMRVCLMDWGATWISCELPLLKGEVREVLLGCASPVQYPQQGAYLGASIGRYANRIAKATFSHDAQTFYLAANQGEHQLHGGPEGFHARRWRIISKDAMQVTYQLHSPDGDQGFPGHLNVQATYTLTEHNSLEISYQATVEKACPVCLTNHAYFNLDGGQTDVRKHQLQLFADAYLPVDSSGIPNAGLTQVGGTGMDFRRPKTLEEDFLRDGDQMAVGGYDHAYLVHRICGSSENPAANLWSSDGRVLMSVFTNAPALQLYSGNFLAGTPSRDGGQYENYAGVALESEFLPDSPNHPEWPQPDCWLKPGEVYRSDTTYQFLVQKPHNETSFSR